MDIIEECNIYDVCTFCWSWNETEVDGKISRVICCSLTKWPDSTGVARRQYFLLLTWLDDCYNTFCWRLRLLTAKTTNKSRLFIFNFIIYLRQLLYQLCSPSKLQFKHGQCRFISKHSWFKSCLKVLHGVGSLEVLLNCLCLKLKFIHVGVTILGTHIERCCLNNLKQKTVNWAKES